ncbi:MAG: aspartate aminotransferase family protein [Actinomycetota bacterium]|nr:aspartate aminotransferase family protein [Actinomycetota bacterium]
MTPPIPAKGKMNNAFDPESSGQLDARTRELVERRQRLLGPAYRLLYDEPVEFVRGAGSLLFDRQGRDYLDAYNNVVSVGHANPRVTEAISAQMATLCTNTRYLQVGILDYSEKLLETFGGSIGETGHVMFTCTGSEANDLAVRVAKHYTGRSGIIVTDEAYHGNSDLTASFSPSLGIASPLGASVRRIPAPDSYRLTAAEVGELLARQTAAEISELERRGDGLAAFVVDSMFSSDGIFTQPTNVLGPVADVVRRSGGLFIADEVQSGFARSGETMWGYQRHGLDPDIITMGKPMGNGFPVAAVALAPDLAQRFGGDTRYFNTFGGNTVAIAAAQATLDVIMEQELLESSNRVGTAIRKAIAGLASRHDAIGDVRGAGLYIGVELVTDRDSKQPNSALAREVVNALRRRRVLISITGYHSNVLKIRPPLIFSQADADRLVVEIDGVFSSIENGD